jgi:hypothetical protein
MNCIVGANQEICTDLHKLLCRAQHQLSHTLPVSAFYAYHVLSEGVRVHRDLWMCVGTEKLRTFRTNCAITQGGTLGRAGYDTDVIDWAIVFQGVGNRVIRLSENLPV